uniref:Uncharacterized protein n=1 Tax=Picea glauca TaxID=3330 RepID=A0A117NGZ1_PICGL|nr:hypothetical protein ABT39_MTgene5741 [Picea glauca]QHR87667.1 hypothetical protein Q903MT_gene1679 [Picea sitchensis]
MILWFHGCTIVGSTSYIYAVMPSSVRTFARQRYFTIHPGPYVAIPPHYAPDPCFEASADYLLLIPHVSGLAFTLKVFGQYYLKALKGNSGGLPGPDWFASPSAGRVGPAPWLG